jgi:hypothetical protein
MFKTYLALATLILTAGAAQAAPVTCNTNVNADPRKGNTSITINAVNNERVSITEVTSGGMAHFVTAPRTFDAFVQHLGPEMVKYVNAEQGFELTVVYQPIGGKIRGTVKTEILGRKVSEPVVCVMALN